MRPKFGWLVAVELHRHFASKYETKYRDLKGIPFKMPIRFVLSKYQKFAAKYKDGLCADLSNITMFFCKLSSKAKNQPQFGLGWMTSWYSLCKEAPLDVRTTIFKENLQDL